ncbi:MAG: alpha-glucan family phosphorylase [Dehalococcoidales bacterium]|nr:alpha-glucan family phosphorylase [Dehalococcoidales bacterium]
MLSDIAVTPSQSLNVAYFSMEFGLDPAMPTYSGGLGILAGDTVRAAADNGLPMVCISLLHRKGYFRQHIDSSGNQTETEVDWAPEKFLQLLPARIIVPIGGKQLQVQVWRYLVHGQSGYDIPVYFLDTAVPENPKWEQSLSGQLYRNDPRYRIYQEAVLGLGGVAMLRALGYRVVHSYHMNEGHSALVTLALIEERMWGNSLSAVTEDDKEAVRQRCVFTTHTPIAAGHDEFPMPLVREVLGEERTNYLLTTGGCRNDTLNMSNLAVDFSRYINGVSMRHEAVSQCMYCNRAIDAEHCYVNGVTVPRAKIMPCQYSEHPIDAITNGVHAVTWASSALSKIYDHYIPEWRRDNRYLRYAIGIPLEVIWQAHQEAKQELFNEINRRTGITLKPDVMTLGFARRATGYKRTDLMFSDLNRLRQIVRQSGPLQIVCGGKAHPNDGSGKEIIRNIYKAAAELKDIIPVVYLEEYDMALAKYVCAGVDLWVNTPLKPLEASGTSGMKTALNGVPSLSILDGWWIEGHVEGVTGWSIDNGWQEESNREREIASLYDKLERLILPMYYKSPADFMTVMRYAISLNSSHFNAQRMVLQYLQNAYRNTGNS